MIINLLTIQYFKKTITIYFVFEYKLYPLFPHRYTRDWRYHKEERVWITRAPGVEPTHKSAMYERGMYYFFDVQNWRRVPKEFHLEYDKLEERPTLPNTMHHNASQQ